MHQGQITLALIAAAVLTTGCASVESLAGARKNASSGQVGCAPAEVTLSDEKANTWTASCRGRVFYCTAMPTASCKEAARPQG